MTFANDQAYRPAYLIAGTAVLILALWLLAALSSVWVLTFGGILLAVLLSGVGATLSRFTPLKRQAAVVIACLLFFGISFAMLWWIGPAFVDGIVQLTQDIPKALTESRRFIDERPELAALIEKASSTVQDIKPGQNLLGGLTNVFSTAMGTLSAFGSGLAAVLIVSVIGIYGAIHPSLYTKAFLSILPDRHKPLARETLNKLASALRWWLFGRASSMAVVGLLTWVGLRIIDIPSAATLGMLAAILSFIPNIGPIISAIPAVLIGLGQSPTIALYVVIIFALVQTIESYVVTPLIQQRVVALPPAVVIVVQLAFGSLLGLAGLLIATPMAVVAMVLIQMLWIQAVLEKRTGN